MCLSVCLSVCLLQFLTPIISGLAEQNGLKKLKDIYRQFLCHCLVYGSLVITNKQIFFGHSIICVLLNIIYMYYSKTTINSLNIKTLSFQLKHIQTSEVTEINNLNLKLNLIQFFNRIITWEGAT